MPKSDFVTTASEFIGSKKLGQPVPESYLASDWKSGASQHTQW